jgi:hypothetical protein
MVSNFLMCLINHDRVCESGMVTCKDGPGKELILT